MYITLTQQAHAIIRVPPAPDNAAYDSLYTYSNWSGTGIWASSLSVIFCVVKRHTTHPVQIRARGSHPPVTEPWSTDASGALPPSVSGERDRK